MANNINTWTRKVAEGMLPVFEDTRTLSKNVNTQKIAGSFYPGSGENVDFKRPTRHTVVETANGDITAESSSPIITGKATGTVQNYITAYLEYDELDEAVNIGGDVLRQTLEQPTMEIVTRLESNFADFMMANSALLAGTPGTAAANWADIAAYSAMMKANGIPAGSWCTGVNSFTEAALSGEQRSIGVNPEAGKANADATIAERFAGMTVKSCETLPSYSTDSEADRAGTLSANPDVTYLTARDTMRQTLAVTAFGANLEVKAGETIQITGRNRLNQATRKTIINAGSPVVFTGTVYADVTLDGSGAGNIVITGPAIYEATGAYNTVDSAPVSGDVVTLLGSASSIIQPNLFWHKDAFSIGSVPIKRLNDTDTTFTTKDGLQIRISYGSDFKGNSQQVRFDLVPAYAALNPFWAGHGFG